MKNIKQIVAQIQSLDQDTDPAIVPLLWQYICYPPKMPVRLQQQQLLDTAGHLVLNVYDEYFTGTTLHFNTFCWGTGSRKILLTHGWASKAADLSEIITTLLQLDDIQIIAFDAPGNGSSESELSNLILFVEAVKATIQHYGQPLVMIGHSLGAMANIIALQELQFMPALLISLTPLVKLKENFEASMDAINISKTNQVKFFENFESRFKMNIATFTLLNQYHFEPEPNHWIAYDKDDQIAPYPYLKDFAHTHPAILLTDYDGIGHHKIVRSPAVIEDLLSKVSSTLKAG